jgi:hypothetical protein
VKGFGKGLGGIMLKPAAAGFGIAGYTMKGMYMEMQKNFGASVQNYIIAARTAQGYEDWQMSTEAERRDIVQRWQAMQKDIKRKRDPDEIVKQVLEDQRKKGQTYLQTSSSWVEGKRQSGQSWVNQKRRSWSNVSSSNAPENRDPESAMLQMGAQSPDAELGSTGHAEQPRVLENDELQEAISQCSKRQEVIQKRMLQWSGPSTHL